MLATPNAEATYTIVADLQSLTQDQNGCTTLHKAAEQGHTDVVQLPLLMLHAGRYFSYLLNTLLCLPLRRQSVVHFYYCVVSQ